MNLKHELALGGAAFVGAAAFAGLGAFAGTHVAAAVQPAPATAETVEIANPGPWLPPGAKARGLTAGLYRGQAGVSGEKIDFVVIGTTFDNGRASAVVTTNARGIAVSPAITPTRHGHTVVAFAPDLPGSAWATWHVGGRDPFTALSTSPTAQGGTR
jgi:hypothetical protein